MKKCKIIEELAKQLEQLAEQLEQLAEQLEQLAEQLTIKTNKNYENHGKPIEKQEKLTTNNVKSFKHIKKVKTNSKQSQALNKTSKQNI